MSDFPDYGVEVIVEGEVLIVRETASGIRYPLYPESRENFFALPTPEEITFARNDKGIVDAVMFGKNARFERVRG